ncbi:MAG: cyclase family protein [Chloroflexota bacterium]
MMKYTALIAGLALLSLSAAQAEDWYPSKYGKDDTLGAINNLSPEKVLQAAKLIKTGKTYALGVDTGPDTPAFPPRSFSMTILQPDDGEGTPLGVNKTTYNDDLLFTWIGIGSQIDGLGHLGINHQYYNGVRNKDFAAPTGLTKFSIHELPPIVTRGVMLDMAGHMGKEILPEGTAFNSAEIKAVAKKQGVSIGKGDVVLFHTGWQQIASKDPARFMAGQPGLGLEGSKYLASLDVVAIGSDTFAMEVLPSEDASLAFPVHQELLAKN